MIGIVFIGLFILFTWALPQLRPFHTEKDAMDCFWVLDFHPESDRLKK